VIPQDLSLVKILKVVLEILPKIELPARRGRPFVYSPRVIVCCFLVMVAKRLSKRGLYAFLTSHDDLAAVMIRETIPFPGKVIPNRRTFDRRLGSIQSVAQLYLLTGAKFLKQRIGLGLARLALDNRMFPAKGGVWHSKNQKQGIIPEKLRDVDQTAGWGKSAYRGWVFGHGLDVFVTTGKLVVPVLALGRSLKIKGSPAAKSVASLLGCIKVKKGIVAADSEYESRVLDSLLQLSGRRLHTPGKRHPGKAPKSKTYQRRKTTVEPLYERILLALSARGKLPFKGEQAWGWLMVGLLLYQLAIIHQVINYHPNPMRVTHLIHIL